MLPLRTMASTSPLMVRMLTRPKTTMTTTPAGGPNTDDFWRDYAAFQGRGVRFLETPRHETYGTVAVFEDLYGNQWDLLQLAGRER